MNRILGTPARPRDEQRLERSLNALFDGLERYFRYEVVGLDNVLQGGSALLVGYHGRPLAWDMIFLSRRLRARTGRYPALFTHRGFLNSRFMTALGSTWGAIYREPSADEVARARQARQHFAVLPGGTRESLRPFWRRYRVDFGSHRGYLRFALKHDLPIVPVVATGIEDAYYGLNDGQWWSEKLGRDTSIPVWLGLGLGGLYPFVPPWPARIRQQIGERLELAPLRREHSSQDALIEAANALVTSTMQTMLNDLRRKTK